MSFISNFDVLLLDVGHTFMFGGYRFLSNENFAATYRSLNGSLLTDELVNNIIFTISRRIKADGKNPAYYECLPSVISYLQKHPQAKNLPASELDLLEQVFASHEVGVISQKHVEVLRKLQQTHKLGIISNIWSKRYIFKRI
ncbi:MAG: hypothetical protein AAFR37_00920 [Cyanobacteria bacterium J06628_3]